LLYATELKKMFYDLRHRYSKFDQAFLRKQTTELSKGLNSVVRQLKHAGFHATLTSTTGSLLARTRWINVIEESYDAAFRGKCHLFRDADEENAYVLNQTIKWTLTIHQPNGKKSLEIFAIMAFLHEDDCEKSLQDAAHYADPKAYTQFPRFIVYTTNEDGNWSSTTKYPDKIQTIVRRFVS